MGDQAVASLLVQMDEERRRQRASEDTLRRELEQLKSELSIVRHDRDLYIAIAEREYQRVLRETAFFVGEQELMKGPQQQGQ